MKNHKMPEAHATHPNVTPLIDVVMCLIIFYMLVARIGVNTGQDAKIELPASLQGKKITDMGNTITLNVLKPSVGDEPMVTLLDPQSGQMIDIKLVDGAKHPLAAFLKLAKGSNEKFRAIIRGDQNLDYRFLEPVLNACDEAKMGNIDFAAQDLAGRAKP